MNVARCGAVRCYCWRGGKGEGAFFRINMKYNYVSIFFSSRGPYLRDLIIGEVTKARERISTFT
ncbi:hypothetical protein J6590_097759 [Homalodisca vitripennis]|nr:hypothetical protein J6590_097759 [Homalodisca vitripennis]